MRDRDEKKRVILPAACRPRAARAAAIAIVVDVAPVRHTPSANP
jgi:hypothetical protein